MPPSVDGILTRRSVRPDCYCRLECAAIFGDVAVIRSMVAAGVDEHGRPLLQARGLVKALFFAAECGHLKVVELLLGAGADVRTLSDAPSQFASQHGYTGADIVQFLIQQGAVCPSDGELALEG